MNRAFVYLYALIVLSVVVIGWGLDKVWQAFSPEIERTYYEVQFYRLLDHAFEQVAEEDKTLQAQSLSKTLEQKIQLIHVDDLADSKLGGELRSGELLSLFDDEGRKQTFGRLSNSKFVVKFYQPAHQKSFLSEVFIAIFYLAIGVVIYFWVWPLSRDLRQLEAQTKTLGRDGVYGEVKLGRGSAVRYLAQAFNRMSKRVRELIASHKDMTYAVSHELRTPLARMKFALEMAQNNPGEDTQKQLQSVREDVNEMDMLITSLLTYAGFEQSEQELDQKEGDLDSLVRTLVDKLSVSESISVNIVNLLHDRSVYCDWDLMERAIHNLLQNAARFAVVNIRVSLLVDDDSYYILVEDDGVGIPPEKEEMIFSSFVRLQSEGNKTVSGFGLGLAIVKRIIKWHNGSVCVRKSVLGGAKFILSWPVIRKDTN